MYRTLRRVVPSTVVVSRTSQAVPSISLPVCADERLACFRSTTCLPDNTITLWCGFPSVGLGGFGLADMPSLSAKPPLCFGVFGEEGIEGPPPNEKDWRKTEFSSATLCFAAARATASQACNCSSSLASRVYVRWGMTTWNRSFSCKVGLHWTCTRGRHKSFRDCQNVDCLVLLNKHSVRC